MSSISFLSPGLMRIPLASEEASAAAQSILPKPQSKLTKSEQQVVRELQRRDAEVRQHEAAHVNAAGGYVRGGPSYEYQRGPDGKLYAVGGEVSLDTSAEKDPEATIKKMQVVRRAALAPMDPSGQDRAVAAQAAQAEMQARLELARERATASRTEKDGLQELFSGGAVADPLGQNIDLLA